MRVFTRVQQECLCVNLWSRLPFKATKQRSTSLPRQAGFHGSRSKYQVWNISNPWIIRMDLTLDGSKHIQWYFVDSSASMMYPRGYYINALTSLHQFKVLVDARYYAGWWFTNTYCKNLFCLISFVIYRLQFDSVNYAVFIWISYRSLKILLAYPNNLIDS